MSNSMRDHSSFKSSLFAVGVVEMPRPSIGVMGREDRRVNFAAVYLLPIFWGCPFGSRPLHCSPTEGN